MAGEHVDFVSNLKKKYDVFSVVTINSRNYSRRDSFSRYACFRAKYVCPTTAQCLIIKPIKYIRINTMIYTLCKNNIFKDRKNKHAYNYFDKYV